MKCLFFNKMRKQIISASLTLFLLTFLSCSLSSIEIMVKHGLVLFCKSEAVLVCSLQKRERQTETAIKTRHDLFRFFIIKE